MTEEKIKARLKKLESDLIQSQANANALSGAIQDCNYWLSELSKEGPSLKVVDNNG